MIDVSDATVLLVDDDLASLRLSELTLAEDGYTIVGTTKPQDVLTQVLELSPDLILLDLHMPGSDGLDVLAALRKGLGAEVYLPVVAFTGSGDPNLKTRALAAGVTDFVSKSSDTLELRLRVRNALRTRFLYQQQRHATQDLEVAVAAQMRQLAAANRHLKQLSKTLAETNEDILLRLAKASEYSDDGSEGHTLRVGQLAYLTARRLGQPPEWCDTLLLAARLHDVGKVAVPDSILLRPGGLSDEEQLLLRDHCVIGAELLSGGKSPLLEMAQVVALSHHERYDGQGYPQGLVAHDIPLEGRITAVADVFDTLTHARPYRPAWSRPEAKELLLDERGRHFDPEVVSAFLDIVNSLPQDIEGEEFAGSSRPKQTHF